MDLVRCHTFRPNNPLIIVILLHDCPHHPGWPNAVTAKPNRLFGAIFIGKTEAHFFGVFFYTQRKNVTHLNGVVFGNYPLFANRAGLADFVIKNLLILPKLTTFTITKINGVLSGRVNYLKLMRPLFGKNPSRSFGNLNLEPQTFEYF